MNSSLQAPYLTGPADENKLVSFTQNERSEIVMKWWTDISAVVATRKLLGRRSQQQDHVVVVPFANERSEDGILAVATDGHSYDGGYAAELSATRIMEGVLEACDRSDETFRQSFLGAHDLLLGKHVDGGTTATCVTVHGDKIVAAWVGNSQARIITTGGDLKTLTIPHEYGVHKAETVRLDALGAVIQGPDEFRFGARDGHLEIERPKRGHVVVKETALEVTRALGDPEFDPIVLHEPEIVSCEIAADDRWLIVATDGLWHAVQRTHKRHLMGRLLAVCSDADSAAAALEKLLGTWTLADNTTFAIVDLRCVL
ncbi:MAG TPA: PP2C family protein-serine/threonine phosphatase [Candidatus Eisenbacteria bacterium]|nr:PP2C family protein-serine/threonine phosphatase [Candidatus Eisenbacteria bacterium]